MLSNILSPKKAVFVCQGWKLSCKVKDPFATLASIVYLLIIAGETRRKSRTFGGGGSRGQLVPYFVRVLLRKKFCCLMTTENIPIFIQMSDRPLMARRGWLTIIFSVITFEHNWNVNTIIVHSRWNNTSSKDPDVLMMRHPVKR